jgi:hypothetical protein
MALGLLATACALPQKALAQFAVTSRGSALGGTGIAKSSGAEALYFNPAGLGRSKALEISISANAYGFSRLSFENHHLLMDESGELIDAASLQANEIIFVPSAVGIAYTHTENTIRHGFGIGLFAPQTRTLEADLHFSPAAFPTSRRSSLIEDWATYQAVAGYGIDLGGVNLGLAVDGIFTSFERIQQAAGASPGNIPEAPVFSHFSHSISGWAFDLRPVIGAAVQWSPLSLGVRSSMPFHVVGTASRDQEYSHAAGDGNQIDQIYTEGIQVGERSPAETGVGGAVDLGKVRFDVDVLLTSPVSSSSPELSALDHTGNLTLMGGAELFLGKSIRLRSGAGARIRRGDRLPADQELAQMNDQFENISRLDLRSGSRMELARQMELARSADSNAFAFSLGGAYLTQGRIFDLALVTIIEKGEHLARSDVLMSDGSLVHGMRRQPLWGTTVLLSIGGTLSPGAEP